MAVLFSIEVTSPLSDDDIPLLSGAAMLLFALANNLNVVPDEEGGEGEEIPVEPPAAEPDPEMMAIAQAFSENVSAELPCGMPEQGTSRVCMGKVGHRGRHLFRVAASPQMH